MTADIDWEAAMARHPGSPTSPARRPMTWVRLQNDPLMSMTYKRPIKSWFTGCYGCERWKDAGTADRRGWLAALSWAEQHSQKCPEDPS